MSKNDDYWLNHPNHPLLNHLILNKVFKHLSGKSLKECRLVCKTWTKFTIPFTRKSLLVNIYDSGDSTFHTLEHFVQVFRSNELGIPVGRFALGPFCATNEVGAEFLEICGEAITEIMLKGQNDHAVEDISELLQSTPNIETFKMTRNIYSRSGNIVKLFPEGSTPRLSLLKKIYICDYFTEKSKNKFCPTFWEELITAAPNISSFDMHKTFRNGRYSKAFFNTMVEVLSLIEKLGREPSVLELEISIQKYDYRQVDSAELFNLLCKMISKPNGLRLKRLVYSVHRDNSGLLLASLLKDTLEELKMGSHNFTSFQKIPKFPNLGSLTLFLLADFNSFINLKEVFPVLENLTLSRLLPPSDPEFPECVEFFPDSDPCPTMKSLVVLGVCLRINAFKRIQTVFPNLIHLVVDEGGRNLEDGVEILREIMTQMTQLKSLTIDYRVQLKRTESMDSILTGISINTLEKIRSILNDMNDTWTAVKRRGKLLKLRNKHSEVPGNANLTNLRKLSICVRGEEDKYGKRNKQCYLTDLTGFLVFYCMSHLTKLDIKFCKMTDACCEMLKRDMRLESFKSQSGS